MALNWCRGVSRGVAMFNRSWRSGSLGRQNIFLAVEFHVALMLSVLLMELVLT